MEEARKGTNRQDPADSNRQLADFVSCFRETKHYLLNSLAIWTAQAEFAQRHPEYYEKLAESIAERSERLIEITHEAEEKLKAFAPTLEKRA
jgi:regulator of sirC expression with transglutaminase-like and TPR domain